ncbi:TonB-dependent receptor [Flavobacterium muglaense]|uniref:TonB-dependent receptor n=1 Tax=Flavobacterium muglaense TaxID=2764716 RepID=A0A923SGX4_9FLAO|nr:TonB-dependent receptor [Flavobacterium muglaense]MBC5839634.1 TonB-dependent receptor [Flavobacterium muglaense]MBC5846161.1 TonB-dependent receptor [Flavobacterium muglaense]
MKKIALLFLLLNVSFLFAQKEVSGVVKDNTGAGLPGVNILEKGTNNGVSTNIDGAYKIKVQDGATLIFSYIGFNKVEKAANAATINVVLSEEGGQALDEIVIVGSRTAPRSNTTSALPIDVVSSKDLASTGQATFDKALQYKIPSFNTVQTPVNDATSLLDPYEIRNMGPSRTLILINGKRKNMSSLVYTQTSPGRGETGADISAIPTDAIERVEILRDGASAQYGSDAIAGVMNIILKKSTNGGSVTVRTGITGQGDGEMYGISMNNGTKVGEKGFLNYTVDFSKTALANRPGTLNATDEFNYWRSGSNTPAQDASLQTQITNFLKLKPDGGNINGSPETAAAKFEVNGGTQLSENTELYYNAAYIFKKVNSYANYRTPYWRTETDYPYLSSLFGNGTAGSYQGYAPTFIGDLNDYNATLGFKSNKNGWTTDASVTIGGNSQIYTVSNSHNRSKYSDLNPEQLSAVGGIGSHSATDLVYADDSKTRYTGQNTFKPGGTSFNHIVGNLDITKEISDNVSIGFGSEIRTENFEILEGDFQSYAGVGADSFQGNTPANSGKFNRYNLGFYADISANIVKGWLVNGTARHENYSDFGSANVWKISTSVKALEDDKLTFRGSVSTGFRAPSLHQIYTEKSQSTFQGGAIAITGIVNNVSTTARDYGVPKLTPEKSTNISVGFGAKPIKNLNVTVDYYRIGVKDRIVLGNLVAFEAGRVSSDPASADYNEYEGKNSKAFFVNGINSITSGIDYVVEYRNINLGTGKLGFNLSGNYTIENKIDGAVKNPTSVQNLGTTAAPIYAGQTALTSGQNPVLAGQTVFNATQDALMFTSRPKFKTILGANYEIGKWGLSLNNTTFGSTKFKQADFSNAGLYSQFKTAQVTDLGVTFSATKAVTISFNMNNIFNVLPKFTIKSDGSASADAIVNNPTLLKKEWNNITFDGRYPVTSYDGSQFSQLGRLFSLSMNYRF